MKLKVASWNVNNRLLKPSHVRFLRSLKCDVVLLQEVNESFHGCLLDAGAFDWGATSLSIRPVRKGEGPRRRLGCSVFGSRRVPLLSMGVLKALPFPERSLQVEVAVGSGSATLVSIHVPPGASWGDLKPKTFQITARWLAKLKGPCVLGIDANSPKTDHPTHAQNEWWYEEEAEVLGEAARHPLKDVLRQWLAQDRAALRRVQRLRPEGPLVVSHVRGNGRRMTPSRYDFIFASPEFRVVSVRYLLKRARAAGSDHALVEATFEV